jgi:hypothetical protein
MSMEVFADHPVHELITKRWSPYSFDARFVANVLSVRSSALGTVLLYRATMELYCAAPVLARGSVKPSLRV